MDRCTVLITGGSRGLGLAIALECARRGANIAICARDQSALEAAADQLRKTGVQVAAITCDLRNRSQIARLFEQIRLQFGGIDMVVNNAGTIAVGPYETVTREDYEDSLGTHFWAMHDVVDAALPLLEQKGGGRIVNVTSIGGKVSVPHLLSYCVGKFAAVGYSEGLFAALRAKRISVTTVVPGLMRTGSPRNAWFKGQHRKEYTWFTLSDTLPLFSVSARSAARTIVDGALRGDPLVVLSLQAKLLMFLHGAMPSLTLRALAFANALLPAPGGVGGERRRGFESESALTESSLTALGRQAEWTYNQR